MSEWPHGRPFAKEHTGLVPVKAAVPMYRTMMNMEPLAHSQNKNAKKV